MSQSGRPNGNPGLELLPQHARMLADSAISSCCPAHINDTTHSLRVSECADGTVLVKCLRGCASKTVLAGLGIELRDLFVPREETRRRRVLGAINDFVRRNGRAR